MLADAAWFANDVAVGAAIVSGIAVFVAVVSMRHAFRQARAAERQADEATNSRQLSENALKAQASALDSQAKNTAEALVLAERSALAAERSAAATKVLAETGQRAWLSFDTLTVAHRASSELPSFIFFHPLQRGEHACVERGDVSVVECILGHRSRSLRLS
jgi:hypothetical protein